MASQNASQTASDGTSDGMPDLVDSSEFDSDEAMSVVKSVKKPSSSDGKCRESSSTDGSLTGPVNFFPAGFFQPIGPTKPTKPKPPKLSHLKTRFPNVDPGLLHCCAFT